MPSHTEKRILPYTSEQLFDLVMDIERYPEFLPWCLASRINSRNKSGLDADVIVGYRMFREKFSSRVHFSRPKIIEVEYMQGPMSHLHNQWAFRDVKSGQCEIAFDVDFSMKAKVLETLIDQFFYRAFMKMVSAFEARAFDLYGDKK